MLASKCLKYFFICLLVYFYLQDIQSGGEKKSNGDIHRLSQIVKVDSNLVQIDGTILDKDNRPVTDLQPGDFDVEQTIDDDYMNFCPKCKINKFAETFRQLKPWFQKSTAQGNQHNSGG